MSNLGLFSSSKFEQLLEKFKGIDERSLPKAVALCRNPNRARERERFESIYARLPEGSAKNRIQRDFLSEEDGSHLGAWAELLVFDWLDAIGTKPVLSPPVQGLHKEGIDTPDFLIVTPAGLKIYMEVCFVQASEKDILATGTVVWTAATSTFKKMGARLEEKLVKYRFVEETKDAYVICVCATTPLIRPSEVRTFFLGTEALHLQLHTMQPLLDGQVFQIHNDEGKRSVHYGHVSGVLVATPQDALYDLEFTLIKHPYAFIPIPENAFRSLRGVM